MPVGEHHDDVKMYQSDLNRWNIMELTPHRDFMYELHDACDKKKMPFLISNHRAEHYWFLNGARKNFPNSEALGEEYRDCALESDGGTNNDSGKLVPTTAWLRDWLASACKMVDKNRPFGTEPFTVFGEEKKQTGGAFRENLGYSTFDYRFTYKTGAIYVFPLSQKARLEFRIRSLCRDNNRGITYRIKKVSLLGSSKPVYWSQNPLYMKLSLDEKVSADLPLCFKIEID